jgi:hypothetical protein
LSSNTPHLVSDETIFCWGQIVQKRYGFERYQIVAGGYIGLGPVAAKTVESIRSGQCFFLFGYFGKYSARPKAESKSIY